MKRVITYGTFDLFHYGHLRILERAKELGDYLIVGVTSDDYDKTRGKINIQQSLMERIEAVKETGLADLIIVEEYEGQKIDDIKRYNVDIFVLGSDWTGKFDYLKDYCEVVYLPRTEGVSSSDIRSKQRQLKMGIVGDLAPFLSKFQREDKYVNGVKIVGICTNNIENMSDEIKQLPIKTLDYNELLKSVDAVYIKPSFDHNSEMIKKALKKGKSVLCGNPISSSVKECIDLFDLAEKNKCVLMEGIRPAYSTAYERLLLLLKAGKIGKIMSVDATITSLNMSNPNQYSSIYEWGNYALLPVFQILGVNYKKKDIISHIDNGDTYTRINFVYSSATASITVAEGAKSEGQLIISGTDGYIYVPAPWWKTDYFEVRFENQTNNQRYFYQLDGEGIRYSLVAFCRSISSNKKNQYVDKQISIAICKIIEDFKNRVDFIEI